MDHKCEFCQSSFTTSRSLENHKKIAKYCLVLQGKNTDKYKCDGCQKTFSNNHWMFQHQCNCVPYQVDLKTRELQKEIQNLKVQNDHLQQTIKDLAEKAISKPTETRESVMIPIPIPLREQMESIFNDEVKDDENDIVCSEITINDIIVISRPIDHYIDATQLCKAGGKKFEDWLSLDSTKEYIMEIESIKGIPSSLLVETNKGDTSRFRRGSWIHFDLSIQLAQWLSPKIEVQVSRWIKTLLKGTLNIDIHLLREKERDIRLKDKRIKQLENVCLSKQRRVDYQEHNVIYLLTTDDHLSRRTYIIGKAKNLKTRLSTYNKTCDHTVVYYRECKNEDDMSTVETMVLSKLHAFREQANRDRFILPEDRDVSFFTQTIDECIRFLD